MTDGHLFNNISLGGRVGNNPGQFRLYSGGLAWKKLGGGKTIEVDKADIISVTWMKIPRSYQLSVGTKEGIRYVFKGFREQDVSNLTNFIQKNTGTTPEEKQLSVSGHNWGAVDINGNMLSFNVGSKEAFEVSLSDVSQTQLQGKTDVVLEFHVDDTTGANEKDSLMDLSFHVPTSNTQFLGDEERPSAHIFWQKILAIADVGSSEEAVVSLEGIAILTPRGRYTVELHMSFLRLQGQTLYPHIVIQFVTENVVEKELSLSEEVLAEKYKDRLQSSYNGLEHEVFSKILRGLSGAKVTRPSTFRSCQDGYAVKSSLKAEDGLLYPLEKGFFFLPKPPTLILHEEIEYVEFERHGAGGASMSSHYFDLLVKLKNDQEHLFRNIQRNEYHNLFNFVSGKNLKILNLGEDGQDRTGAVAAALQSTDDDPVDPHLERIKNQAGDEESDEEGSDASISDGEKEKSSKKEASSSKPPVKRKPKNVDVEGSEKRKPKKKQKKDPNAPKRAIAPFMYFSKAERANLKNINPELSTTDIAKKLGEKWQKMSAEEKQPYVEQSQVDKKRYAEESAAYRGAGAAPVDVDSADGSSD
ncbi:unnamed protein product [Triticum turgidum subsp. durum]|uniref:HMG box domain-containing protein n=1 Tax=Triticum turgidum subsp. durum TaxID=4567 RepID=A0A9R0QSH8_TRITD|nr:unnamed protein product [Triticum turgidum subsp. durum]